MYPNFITSEAVLASENLVFHQDSLDKHAYNATLLPFIRNTVAAMDFAPVFLNDRLSKNQDTGTIRKTTDAFELATGVLYFSPIQHFGVTPNNLNDKPDFIIDALKIMPSVWDDTKFISGEPGSHAVLAREKGGQWFVAAVNGEDKAKSLSVKVPMLAGKDVTLIYDKSGKEAAVKTVTIDDSGQLTLNMLPQGGALIYTK